MASAALLNKPWMIAVWPGLGNVASMAGYYLLAKLGMRKVADIESADLFEVSHVEIRGGLIRAAAPPRCQVFAWTDPNSRRDLLLFLGEAQPAMGKYTLCERLLTFGKEQGVERVFTFAALATPGCPRRDSRVFAAATDAPTLEDLRQADLETLPEGRVGGMNGIFLAAAASAGLSGACLLGEMPHLFSTIPYPKAALAVLETFTALAEIEMDFEELSSQAFAAEAQLGGMLDRLERNRPAEPAPSPSPPGLNAADEARIEAMFRAAEADLTKAYELKRELDRLQVFAQYEDRFLDLFRP